MTELQKELETVRYAIDRVMRRYATQQVELPKKDYEILDRVHDEGTHSVVASEDCGCKIFSVKRLMDGCVFSVLDYVMVDGEKQQIKAFSEFGGTISVNIGNNVFCPIGHIVKYKAPLFTTEDGVDVFSGDSFFCVTDDFQILRNDLAQQSHVGVRLRAFATIPAAEVWVLMNKPCLSVMDVDSAYTLAPKCSPIHEDLMLNLEAIAKSRI